MINEKQLVNVEYFKYLDSVIKMMQEVYMKLNSGFPWQSSIQQEHGSFHQQIGLKFQEETIRVLHLDHSFVWCRNVDSLESRSEILGKL
jgi:hypothetical protein